MIPARLFYKVPMVCCLSGNYNVRLDTGTFATQSTLVFDLRWYDNVVNRDASPLLVDYYARLWRVSQ